MGIKRTKAFSVLPSTSTWIGKPGIRPGVKLFEGTRKGAVLSGNSYSFKNGCEPISFAVTAVVTNERKIVFTGEAPVRSSGCNATTSTRTVTLQWISPSQARRFKKNSVL